MSRPNYTAGFCYVANTSRYLAEAKLSIQSLKRQIPSAKVCVIAPRDLWDGHPEVDDWCEPRLTDRTPIVKNDATLAPYDRVAFVDTDTRITGDLSDVFGVLDAFHLALAHEPTRGWDYETVAARSFCELNTGFIVFRNDPVMREFFDLWMAEYRIGQEKQGLVNDQPAFRAALWKSQHIRLATLPSEYHCICGKPVSVAWEVKLLHYRGDAEWVEQEINREQGYRAYIPGLGVARAFRGRKSWVMEWLRLTANAFRILVNPSLLQGKTKKPHQWHLGEDGN